MFHVRDYHQALDKITTAPIELTEKDFDVLRAFNPADEIRGRAAVRQAQLAILTTAEVPLQTKAEVPLQTKAADPSPAARLDSREVAKWIGLALKHALPPRDAHVKVLGYQVSTLQQDNAALTHRVDELEALTKQQAATLVELRDENKALGQLVVDTPRRAPSTDRTGSTKH